MDAKQRVMAWISLNFDKVSTEDFPVLPGGTLVKDKNGNSMLVFLDALTDEIAWVFEEVKRIND